MPYIAASARPPIDEILDPLVNHLKALPLEDQDGALNYVVTRLLVTIYPERYFHINRALGVLSAVTQEYYRTQVAPYEDLKRQENGAVIGVE